MLATPSYGDIGSPVSQTGDRMFEPWHFLLFLSAAGVLAVMPGPGIFYVAARTLAGGHGEGLASSFGTGLGGFVHIIAGAIGVSAVVMASAEAFTALKIVGALYLVYLGIKTWREAGAAPALGDGPALGARRAFKEGAVVEALNPKTAAFFLAFLPQFVVPADGHVALQFVVLGTISVALNTAVDVAVTYAASAVRDRLTTRPAVVRRLRQASGGTLCTLGVTLALARRPA
jgi:threonine/homoserine/homoserine lactone efflux protein